MSWSDQTVHFRWQTGVVEVETTMIECPRCHKSAEVVYYGPCDACRVELRATVGSEQTQIVAPEYEPKMNVTPNAVALKD